MLTSAARVGIDADARLFVCKGCGKTFNSKGELQAHDTKIHGK